GTPQARLMLAIRDLEMAYGGQPVLKLEALDAEAGEQLCVVGPSGTGKTTLLNVIAGLQTPTRGSVRVGDVKVETLTERERDAFRAANVGYVFQGFHLLQALSALENVELATRFGGGKKNRALELLDALGVRHRAQALPSELSVGERQRVAIARALVNGPRLLLADEPTANLDDRAAERALAGLCESAADHDATLLVVTHDSRARERFDRVVELTPP
ncbi:MAG: ABC transporter ATP-binding protein, partial [Myxococcota bacterium]